MFFKKSTPSRYKRQVYIRKLKNFWIDFSHNKIGFAGAAIVAFFIILAIIGPYTTPYLPMSQLYRPPKVAGSYAAPAWLTIFPQYRDYNPTINFTRSLKQVELVKQIGHISIHENSIIFYPQDKGENASIYVYLGNISYKYSPPPNFDLIFRGVLRFNGALRFETKIALKNYTANPTWQQYFKDPNKVEATVLIYDTTKLTANFTTIRHTIAETLAFRSIPNPAENIFSIKGNYGVYAEITFYSLDQNNYAELTLDGIGIIIWGRVHGILGTNFHGYDVWTELVYGARISLLVGLLSAILATTLGVFYGVVSGFLGGMIDEFLMRVVDVLLCLPVLPILLILSRLYSPNVYHVVVLIAIFGWQGLSRVIRSRVLSLKELAFIESAKASGASDKYIIFRHLIPNVIPIATAAMILAIPGAIITEASLSFLGFGDPNASTWGRMMFMARELGGFSRGAWWEWFIPGLSITLICVGFVFIGHAVDEIINPRLRRRR